MTFTIPTELCKTTRKRLKMRSIQYYIDILCLAAILLAFSASGTYVEVPSSNRPSDISPNQGAVPSYSYYNHRAAVIADDPQLKLKEAIELGLNETSISQRSKIPKQRGLSVEPTIPEDINPASAPENIFPENSCVYDKEYFSKLDECLARKPFPTVGLTAFKNEDLLTKKSFGEKTGCVFVLANGLFKNHQIAKFSVESESQCLDASKVRLSLSFVNVTQNYIWTLRCLNKADQLLDDVTFNGATSAGVNGEEICVGSSQNFGFTSLQLSNIEVQVDLATDIYRNWRVVNINDALAPATHSASKSRNIGGVHPNDGESILAGAGIREFVFESLDGDELNWRYMNIFQNWTRNRLHGNFLDQYRRFLWISLQRCLSEHSKSLPVRPVDIFSEHRI